MAVNIVLTENGKTRDYNENTSICFFDDGGDFWFLQPFFKKLKAATSQTIDLYDDCKFIGKGLVNLKIELIKEINRIGNLEEDKWEQYIGTQTHPIKKELYKDVTKIELLDKLEKWLNITELAIDTNEYVLGLGD